MRDLRHHVACLLVVLSAASTWGAEPVAERLIYSPPLADGDIGQIDLNRLTARLIDVLQEMHVEKDTSDPQYGMIYETFDPQRKLWVEGEGRDTMHHMMWTMVGLSNNYRATHDQKSLDFLYRYPYAFYLRMMLQGEKIFGPEYGNGYCPYWWDDGDAIELGGYLKGQPDVRVSGHSLMSSVHLAQDLAVGHLDLWWLTADPRLKQVTADLYLQMHYGKIAERFAARNYALIEKRENPSKDLAKFRAAEAEGKELLLKMPAAERRALYEKQFGPNYGAILTVAQKCINQDESLPLVVVAADKPTDNLAWLRLRERKSGSIPAYPDDVAFDYYMTLSGCAQRKGITEAYARWFTMWFLSRALLNEYWMDDAPYHHGYVHFPGANTQWTMKDGRFLTYRSQAPWHFWHTRSIHMSWMTAIAMQMMDQWPEMHEHYRREIAADDPVIRFTDRTPQLDGRPDDGYAIVFDEPAARLAMISDPRSLFLCVKRHQATDMTVTIHETENNSDHRAVVQIGKDGSVRVVNAADQRLLFWSTANGDELEIQVPYMIHRPQKDWLTAVEHGRHKVEWKVGKDGTQTDQTRTVYFLSDAERIKHRLRAAVEGSIVNHAAILEKQGWLPYAVRDKSNSDFSKLSFSGAYGHLIHTIGQYQNWRQGHRDWELKQNVHADLKK